MKPARPPSRRHWLRLVPLHGEHLQSARQMRECWREGITLQPREPEWAKGSGTALKWDDE